MKLNTIVKDLEVELENRNQENNRLKAETVNLHDQILHTRAALEQGVQERVSMDEENEYFKQRLRSLEIRINDPQVSGASCFGDDFAHDELEVSEISGICAKCRTTTDMNSRRSSMQCGVLNSSHTFRRVFNENHDRQLSEISTPKVYKRRLFDDKDNSTSELHKVKDQYWNEPEMRSLPGNAVHTDIPAALGRLFCRIKQLADPNSNSMESGRTQERASEETNNLKASLHLANRLAKELLQELHSIVNHDIRCLEGHVASNGVVGKSIKNLQLLLLENADVGLCLFYILSSKASSLAPHKFIQEFSIDGAINSEDDLVAKNVRTIFTCGLLDGIRTNFLL